MRENNTNTPGWNPALVGQPFADGAPVYDAAGERIGSVSGHKTQAGYLIVHKGGLFPKDAYVPVSAIARGDAAGVYLNMYKDELKRRNWESPPTQPAGADGSPARGEVHGAQAHEREDDREQVHQDVIEEPRSAEIPVTHEEISVERVPSHGAGHLLGPDVFQERDIEVPVMGERVMREMRSKVSEEIHLHKQEVTEQQHLDEMARNGPTEEEL